MSSSIICLASLALKPPRVLKIITVELTKCTILLRIMESPKRTPIEDYLNGHSHIQNITVHFDGL